ncbi:MAG TPA: DUF4190 domain-containing protein [Urbifossiella sp.]|jgi:hypothetical protein|nr:DUF4190 domain-containing protein [Urbifossiella sp.]
MANVRLTCPACNAELEIGAEHLGQEIECGNCLRPFVAEVPRDRSERRRQRDEDDDDDRPSRRRRTRRSPSYDDDFDYNPERTSGASGVAVAALVLGILSFPLLCCCHLNVPVAIAGIVCGILGLQKNSQSRGMALAGLILSILSLVASVGLVAVGVGLNMFNPNNPGQFKFGN